MAHAHKADPTEVRPYFITSTIVNWLPIFTQPAYCLVVLDSLHFMRQSRGLAVHAYVIMPTHMHAIVSPFQGDLPGIMRDFKKFTSRSIFELAKNDGRLDLTQAFQEAAVGSLRARFRVWQDGYCPEIIYSQKFCDQKRKYLHANPVRKGLVEDPAEWHFSSFRAYGIGDMEPVAVDPIIW
jgi:putative transposase